MPYVPNLHFDYVVVGTLDDRVRTTVTVGGESNAHGSRDDVSIVNNQENTNASSSKRLASGSAILQLRRDRRPAW